MKLKISNIYKVKLNIISNLKSFQQNFRQIKRITSILKRFPRLLRKIKQISRKVSGENGITLGNYRSGARTVRWRLNELPAQNFSSGFDTQMPTQSRRNLQYRQLSKQPTTYQNTKYSANISENRYVGQVLIFIPHHGFRNSHDRPTWRVKTRAGTQYINPNFHSTGLDRHNSRYRIVNKTIRFRIPPNRLSRALLFFPRRAAPPRQVAPPSRRASFARSRRTPESRARQSRPNPNSYSGGPGVPALERRTTSARRSVRGAAVRPSRETNTQLTLDRGRINRGWNALA